MDKVEPSSMMLGALFYLCGTVEAQFFGEMTGPPKHKGVFFKKQSGSNKTIPFSESPGEEMIVFDVDGTLWPFEIDSDPRFKDPFTIKSYDNGSVFVGNHTIEVFPEVEATLLELIEKGYVLAAVSLTNSTYKTMAVLNAFDLTKHFKYMEMGPEADKLSLITAISERSGIPLEDFLYFEKDPGEVIDLIWKHVIIYCVDERGLSKECARKGLYVFDIRPRKEKRQQGQHDKSEKRELTNKNKCRPAYEKDGTEIEGFDYNATQIEYSLQEQSGIDFESILFLMYEYTRSDIHSLLDLGVSTLPIGVSGASLQLLADALFIFSTRKHSGDISDNELPTTTESRAGRKVRKKENKLKRRNARKLKKCKEGGNEK